MGNCCAGTSNEGEVNILQGAGGFTTVPTKNLNELFDDRVVLGLKGRDKISIIVKIQALIRGSLARRHVRQRWGFQAKTLSYHNNRLGFANPTEANYQNERVQEIKNQLGPF